MNINRREKNCSVCDQEYCGSIQKQDNKFI